MCSRIASLNIGGVSSTAHLNTLCNLCKENKVNFLALQEVKNFVLPELESLFNVICHPGRNRRGTAFCYPKTWIPTDVMKDVDGRVLRVDFGPISFVVIYAPSGSCKKEKRNVFFNESLLPFLCTKNKRTLLMGDFNAITNHSDYQTSAKEKWRPNKFLLTMTASFNLVDLWQHLNGNGGGFTHVFPNGQSRIDRIYSSNDFLQNVKDISIVHCTISDHAMLVLEMSHLSAKATHRKTKGPWKMNTSHLLDEQYQSKFSMFWSNVSSLPLRSQDCIRWWETVVKPSIKRISIQYARQKAENDKATRRYFQDLLTEILPHVGVDENAWETLQEVQDTFKEWEKQSLQGLSIRSRQEICEKEEASLRHASQHNKRCTSNTVTHLKTKNGLILTDQEAVMREIEQHFLSLFTQQNRQTDVDENSFLAGLPVLPDVAQLTGPITKEEILCALRNKKKNKAPGLDGIPYELYLQFWDLVGDDMTILFNTILQTGHMSESQRTALIRLIPKKENPLSMADYRPISLLCTDYKILATVLDNRLRRTLGFVIGDQQKGAVPGRTFYSNLTLFRDTIQLADDKKRNAALIAVDLEKAYDNANRNVIWRTMIQMGYPGKFIQWLKTLYTDTSVKVMNGQRLSEPIATSSSLRQGCPLSVPLFVLYIEPLIRKLEASLEGFDFFGRVAKVRALIDDVTILTGSESDVRKAQNILSDFCSWSGARINFTKSEILGLGGWQNRQSWPWSEVSTTTRLSVCGIAFCQSIEETSEHMWASTYRKMVGTMVKNADRRLTIHQRVAFIKCHVLAKATYLAHVLPCPMKTEESIRSKILKFIWYKKMERAKQGVVFQSPSKGGLGLQHPGAFFQALFLRTLFNTWKGADGPERRMMEFWLEFPLRKEAQVELSNSKAKEILRTPTYLTKAVKDLKLMFNRGLLTTKSLKVDHKAAYKLLSLPELGEPKLVSRWPHLDWETIWENLASLPANPRETVFLLNHDLLPTRSRQKKLDAKTDALCPLCRLEEETANHFLVSCPAKQNLNRQIYNKCLALHGGSEPQDLSRLLRLDTPPAAASERELIRFLGVTVHHLWCSRLQGKIPAVKQIEKEVSRFSKEK